MTTALVFEIEETTSSKKKDAKVKNPFDYNHAFCRNIGLFSLEEQQKLRHSKVAFAGVGAMGSSYVQAMARAGLGHFVLADGDEFDMVNFNRQSGATMSSIGINKAEVLKKHVFDINPEATISLYPYLDEKNIDSFLEGVELVINGIEAFAPNAYRLLYKKAREKSIPVISSAPMAFGAAVLIFGSDSKDMSADEYFDWHDSQSDFEKIVHFLIGLAPRGLHLRDVDLKSVDLNKHLAPSNISGVMIGAGLVAVEAYRILLNWDKPKIAPFYRQTDARRGRVVSGRLRWGNRGILQRIKKYLVLRQYKQCH